MVTHVNMKAQLKYVSPDLLDFDPDNPRFAGLMDNRSQCEIQKEILGPPYYASELIDSLVENGFIDYEPLVVRRKGKRYSVVEGNRRLAAIKEIRANPQRYRGPASDLESIPVLEFPEKPVDQQKNEMRVYLGVRHLLGFREWPPVSKAQFLEHASKAAGGLDGVIRETGILRAEVRRFLVPYRLLQSAGVSIPKGEDFWVLGEALGRSGIKRFLQLHIDPKTLKVKSFNRKNFSLLLDYLYGPKVKDEGRDSGARVLSDTRDLSRLARVLGSEAATDALRAGRKLEEAEIYVDTREQSIDRLSKVTKSLGVLLRKIIAGRRDKEGGHLLKTYRQFQAAVNSFVSRVK